MAKGYKKTHARRKPRRGGDWSMFNDFMTKTSNEVFNPDSVFRSQYVRPAINEFANPQSKLRTEIGPAMDKYGRMIATGLDSAMKADMERKKKEEEKRKQQAAAAAAATSEVVGGRRRMSYKAYKSRRGYGWFDDIATKAQGAASAVGNELFNPESVMRQGIGMAGDKTYNEFANPESDMRQGIGMAGERLYNEFTNPESNMRQGMPSAGEVWNEISNPNSALRGQILPYAGQAAKSIKWIASVGGPAAAYLFPKHREAILAISRFTIAAAEYVEEAAEINDLTNKAQNGDAEAAGKLIDKAVNKLNKMNGMSTTGKGFRRSNPTAKARGEKIRQIMHQRGVSLPEASRILARSG